MLCEFGNEEIEKHWDALMDLLRELHRKAFAFFFGLLNSLFLRLESVPVIMRTIVIPFPIHLDQRICIVVMPPSCRNPFLYRVIIFLSHATSGCERSIFWEHVSRIIPTDLTTRIGFTSRI